MAEISKDKVLEAMQAFAKMKMEQEKAHKAEQGSENVTSKEGSNEISKDSVFEAMQSFANVKVEQENAQVYRNTDSGVFDRLNTDKDQSNGVSKKRGLFESSLMNQHRLNLMDTIFGKEQPFERISSEPNTVNAFNQLCKHKKYEKETNFGEVFNRGNTEEECINSLMKVSEYILQDLEEIFGGLHRITDLVVSSDILIFNRVSYQPKLSEKYMRSLPADIQYAVRNGCFAWLFNFRNINRFPNLVNLSFDNFDFVYKKVRVDIGESYGFEPRDLFRVSRGLRNLQIGEKIFTRKNVGEYNNVFHTARRSTQIADAIGEFWTSMTIMSWSFVADLYRDKNSRGLIKVAKVAGMAGVSMAATTIGVSGAVTRAVASSGFSLLRNGFNTVNYVCDKTGKY